MKDFHDLYSLISIGSLNAINTKKAIELVFNHRKTSLKGLPIAFDTNALEQLEKGWSLYHRRLKPTKNTLILPNSINNLIDSINQWLHWKTSLCKKNVDQ
ncbi:hypothetical protein [Candidatus Protochlamydia amoebophila]|uniref:Uncharacterized protein n=1 Tax=Candidatus Protochlamydia amoebophila TaxID=362787 RepID=A0A0C1GYV9_9BACT|nr:hypothetical protein [Candidatus Protochlamydia amoebophila]KIC70774.1 hypothetical protein DB44_FX00030 [Candidatus Protochlamydia amoebophila]